MFMITSLGIFLELEIFQTKVVEKIDTNILCLYEITWKNTAKSERTNIHKFNKYCLSTAKKVTRMRHLITL